MLRSLTVRGFALLEDVRVELEPGLNVVTGETGAGKSLLVGALAFLLGERADASRVRAGAGDATVEGLFELEPGPSREELLSLLDEKTGSTPDDGVVVLSRTLDRQGRARAFANNRHLTRDSLREITSRLVTVHGQAENSTLARPATQRDKLDAFCGLLAEGSARQDFARARAEAVALQRELDGLLRAERERLDRLDLLRFQSGEIRAAELAAGEMERLASDFQTLSNAERIVGIVGGHLDTLHEAEGSATERLAAARRALEELRPVAPQLAPLADRLEEARLLVSDAVGEARRFIDGIEGDPRRLAAVSERIDRIQRVLERFRVDEAGALALLASMEGELGTLERSGTRAAELGGILASKLAELRKVGNRLTKARREAAPRLAAEVLRTLAGLGMERARFQVAIGGREPAPGGAPAELATSTEAGFDQVEFELAPNPGEPFQPLGNVASGGELARVALAIESACADVATIPTILFDEIDENVGGRLGPALGAHLARAAKSKQVLVVTHLAGVAAHAHRHLLVTKEMRGGRTHTNIAALDGEARVPELAAMMGGDSSSEVALADARELLHSARDGARGVGRKREKSRR
jgi:DNA repair protein RecN (Recombination protein N)